MNDRRDLRTLIVEANPVPDPVIAAEQLDADREVLAMIDERAEAHSRELPEMGRLGRTRPRRWAGAWAFAAAILIAAVSVGLVVLIARQQPVENEPTTTTSTTTSTTTTVPPSPDALAAAWGPAASALTEPLIGVSDVAAYEDGFVGVGFEWGEDSLQDGAVLVSDDGATWRRVGADDPALTVGAVLMYGVTQRGGGIVGVGMGCEDETGACQPHPTSWWSSDGSQWTRSQADPDVLGEFGAFQDVVETDDGIVAVGSMGERVDDVPVLHAAIWRSPDGVRWERVLTGEASTAGESDVDPEVLSIASDPSGRLIAVGTTVASDGRGVAAVWISDDGRSWERVEPNAAVFSSVREGGSAVMFGVTYGPDGWVAVGTDAHISAAVWKSIDGMAWIRIDESTQPFGAAGSLTSVTALPHGYATVGPMGFFDVAASEARMWISADGENWRRALDQGDGYAMGIAVNGDVAVMTGAQIWSGPVFDPLNPPPDPGPSPTDQRYLNGPAPLVTLLGGETCDDLSTAGYPYASVVAYWARFDAGGELDEDGNGRPCEAQYTLDEIEDVYPAADGTALEITRDLAADTFRASGPAVEAGIICAAGSVTWLDGDFESWRDEVQYRSVATYTCADESGNFDIGADLFLTDQSGGGFTDFSVWNIEPGSGTGRYEGLVGGGAVASDYATSVETFSGWVAVGDAAE